MELYNEFRESGGDPNVSDAYTINGQPGDLYPCSKSGIFELGYPFSKLSSKIIHKKKKKKSLSSF